MLLLASRFLNALYKTVEYNIQWVLHIQQTKLGSTYTVREQKDRKEYFKHEGQLLNRKIFSLNNTAPIYNQ